MRAVLVTEPNAPLQFVANRDAPVAAGDAEIIDVTACGVCHSDLHVVDGTFPSPLPMVLGHEVTGVHAELGPVMVYAPWGLLAFARKEPSIVRPVDVMPLEQAQTAHDRLRAGQTQGRIVLTTATAANQGGVG